MIAEQRILLLALRGRDAQVIAQLLAKQGQESHVCLSAASLATELAGGGGTALITEESLADGDLSALSAWLEQQPAWSDFPFVLLATKRSGRRGPEALKTLAALGNVVVLERPIHGETLSSAVTSALRVRRRQYEARRRLEELQAAEEGLRHLNATLETRILARTEELSHANNQLMQEVSERERAQAALVQSQKMEAIGRLTGGIAHDFNNLLTVIFGNLEMIQRRTDEERVLRLAKFAAEAAERAAKLTHQLLAFSRTQKLTLRPVDLNGLIVGMNDLLIRTIGPQIRIVTRLSNPAPWAMADENQLELAILNLAINARDAMPDGGVLTIATSTEPADEETLTPGAYGVIRVADTGIGIPRHLISKIFDPFFTTKPIGKGTGLGLSQVFGIARQSGGTVQIDSDEGAGARFTIWLPLASPPSAVTDLPADAPHAQRGQGRILVIDDDAGVRRFIAECLEMLGYQVSQADSGQAGLARLGSEAPDLLIVDYAMPGMNGVEVIQMARARAPNLPIILATGYADMDAVDKVIGLGRVLRKPFRIDDLQSAVHDALKAPQTAHAIVGV
jgi:signal transduction histidine kinase/ActR/RegA family two-component response regulator